VLSTLGDKLFSQRDYGKLIVVGGCGKIATAIELIPLIQLKGGIMLLVRQGFVVSTM